MSRDYRMDDDMHTDTHAENTNNATADFGSELADDTGIDLNKDTADNGKMSKEIDDELNAIREIDDLNTGLRPSEYAEYTDAEPYDLNQSVGDQGFDIIPD